MHPSLTFDLCLREHAQHLTDLAAEREHARHRAERAEDQRASDARERPPEPPPAARPLPLPALAGAAR